MLDKVTRPPKIKKWCRRVADHGYHCVANISVGHRDVPSLARPLIKADRALRNVVYDAESPRLPVLLMRPGRSLDEAPYVQIEPEDVESGLRTLLDHPSVNGLVLSTRRGKTADEDFVDFRDGATPGSEVVRTCQFPSEVCADTVRDVTRIEHDPSWGPERVAQFCVETRRFVGLGFDFRFLPGDDVLPVTLPRASVKRRPSSIRRASTGTGHDWTTPGTTLVVDTRGMMLTRDPNSGDILRSLYQTLRPDATVLVTGSVVPGAALRAGGRTVRSVAMWCTGHGSRVVIAQPDVTSVAGHLAAIPTCAPAEFFEFNRQEALGRIAVLLKRAEDRLTETREVLQLRALEVARLREREHAVATAAPSRIAEQVVQLGALPGLEDLRCESRTITFRTAEFSHTDPEIGTRFLGRYEFRIDLRHGRIDLRNLAMASADQPACTTRTYDGVCLGSYDVILLSALATCDYVALAAALVEFVRDPHLGDGHARRNFVNKFPHARPDVPHASEYVQVLSLPEEIGGLSDREEEQSDDFDDEEV